MMLCSWCKKNPVATEVDEDEIGNKVRICFGCYERAWLNSLEGKQEAGRNDSKNL